MSTLDVRYRFQLAPLAWMLTLGRYSFIDKFAVSEDFSSYRLITSRPIIQSLMHSCAGCANTISSSITDLEHATTKHGSGVRMAVGDPLARAKAHHSTLAWSCGWETEEVVGRGSCPARFRSISKRECVPICKCVCSIMSNMAVSTFLKHGRERSLPEQLCIVRVYGNQDPGWKR